MNFGQPPNTQTLNAPSINDHNSQSPERALVVNDDYQHGSSNLRQQAYNSQHLHGNVVADNTTIAPAANPSARGHTSRATEASPNAKRNKLVMQVNRYVPHY
jgi:hypothetical protein